MRGTCPSKSPLPRLRWKRAGSSPVLSSVHATTHTCIHTVPRSEKLDIRQHDGCLRLYPRPISLQRPRGPSVISITKDAGGFAHQGAREPISPSRATSPIPPSACVLLVADTVRKDYWPLPELVQVRRGISAQGPATTASPLGRLWPWRHRRLSSIAFAAFPPPRVAPHRLPAGPWTGTRAHEGGKPGPRTLKPSTQSHRGPGLVELKRVLWSAAVSHPCAAQAPSALAESGAGEICEFQHAQRSATSASSACGRVLNSAHTPSQPACVLAWALHIHSPQTAVTFSSRAAGGQTRLGTNRPHFCIRPSGKFQRGNRGKKRSYLSHTLLLHHHHCSPAAPVPAATPSQVRRALSFGPPPAARPLPARCSRLPAAAFTAPVPYLGAAGRSCRQRVCHRPRPRGASWGPHPLLVLLGLTSLVPSAPQH